MKSLLLGGALLTATFLAPAALAQTAETDVVGPPDLNGTSYTLNGKDYNYRHIINFTNLLVPNPEQYDMAAIYPIMADLAIEGELAADAARAAGLDQDPQLMADIQLLINSVLSNAYLEREVAARTTPERLRGAYDAYVAAFVAEEQATASHILLEDEAAAVAAIERLKAGEDFGELAKELSTGPSGPRGGALGTFGKGQMVAPFEEAVFAMEAGSFTETPVETQFGFHVIYLESLAKTAPESFEAMETTIAQGLDQEIQTEIREELRTAADYTIVPFDELPRLETEAEAN